MLGVYCLLLLLFLLFVNFSYQHVFFRSDRKTSQVPRTLLRILTDFSNAVSLDGLSLSLFPTFLAPLPNIWRQFQTDQLQLVLGPSSGSIFFSYQASSKYLSQCHFLWFLLCSPLGEQILLFARFWVESTEKDIETRWAKAWTAINRIIWKSDLTDKMKRSFFKAAVTSILLYGCTTCTLTKRLEKKLDGNYTRMLRAILNKSWRQHPTRHQLYGHLPPITKTVQVRRTRHAGHCWRSRDELIRDVLLWTPTHGRAKAGRPARTYIQQLCEDTGCCPEDLPKAMNYREEWRERVRDIRATSAIWWLWSIGLVLQFMMFLSQNCRGFYTSHFQGRILFYAYTIW